MQTLCEQNKINKWELVSKKSEQTNQLTYVAPKTKLIAKRTFGQRSINIALGVSAGKIFHDSINDLRLARQLKPTQEHSGRICRK
jgi:hypothetical protein